jgi:thymidylate synthase
MYVAEIFLRSHDHLLGMHFNNYVEVPKVSALTIPVSWNVGTLGGSWAL